MEDTKVHTQPGRSMLYTRHSNETQRKSTLSENMCSRKGYSTSIHDLNYDTLISLTTRLTSTTTHFMTTPMFTFDLSFCIQTKCDVVFALTIFVVQGIETSNARRALFLASEQNLYVSVRSIGTTNRSNSIVYALQLVQQGNP